MACDTAAVLHIPASGEAYLSYRSRAVFIPYDRTDGLYKRSDSMREWVLGLTKKERCLLHDFEYIFARNLSKDEYNTITKEVPSEYAAMGRVEFFREFPHLRAWRDKKAL